MGPISGSNKITSTHIALAVSSRLRFLRRERAITIGANHTNINIIMGTKTERLSDNGVDVMNKTIHIDLFSV
jgi:hypothetical protein